MLAQQHVKGELGVCCSNCRDEMQGLRARLKRSGIAETRQIARFSSFKTRAARRIACALLRETPLSEDKSILASTWICSSEPGSPSTVNSG